MKLSTDNVEITLEFDEDGFPLISIDLNGFQAEHSRPAVEIKLNQVVVHEMFDDSDSYSSTDMRWDIDECLSD